MTSLPLAGLKVLEISAFVAAPLGGMTLAQLGADVIRIDPMGGAADHQRWPVTKDGLSLYWAGLNKGKRSICLDLRSPEGIQLISEILQHSGEGGGIVITNAVGRSSLSYETLREVREDLVLLQIQGHQDGRAAVDYTVNAGVGFPMITGPEGHADPVNHVLPAWDIACGLYGAVSILAAERRRRIEGVGADLKIALHDVALAMAGNLGFLAEAQVNGVTRRRIGNYLYGGFARDFVCRDGRRVMVVALTTRHWRELVHVCGMAGPVDALETSLGVDFTREDDRFTYREVLAGLLSSWFGSVDYETVASELAPTSLLWSPYRAFIELGDEVASNEITQLIVQPGVGPLHVPGSPIRLGDVDLPVAPAPTLGAHTREVLGIDLGMSSAQIDDLERRRVIST